MSRLVSLLIVLLAIAVATPVLAEERLSLSGQMRIRGWYLDNQFPEFNDDTGGADTSFNQRLRIGSKLSVAEGVSVNFRADLGEGDWGKDRTAFALDQAFITLDKQMFNLRAGRLYYGIGNAIAVDVTGDGAVFTLKGAIPVEIGYFKRTERMPLDQDNDVDLYTLAVKHSTDMYNAVVFGGYLRDGGAVSAENTDLYGIGLQTSMKLDPINLNFELNYFTGEEDWAGGDDLKGLQAYLDANMAISETVTAGAAFFYAQGQDDDVQITELANDDSFAPEIYSFFTIQFPIFGSLNSTFDPSGDDKGVIAAQAYGDFKVMDDLSLRASVGYWQMEEDYTTAEKSTSTSAYDSFITVVGSSRYALAANTNLDLVAAYLIPEAANSLTEDDPSLRLGFNLNVNF